MGDFWRLGAMAPWPPNPPLSTFVPVCAYLYTETVIKLNDDDDDDDDDN